MPGLSRLFDTLTGKRPRESTREQARRILRGIFGHDILTMEPDSGGYIRSARKAQNIPYNSQTESAALQDAGVTSGSYYSVFEGYTEPGDPTYVPLKVDIGFVGKQGFAVEVLSIYLDHEKPSGVEITFCGPWALGLDSAEGKVQTMLLMKTAGRLMKRIEAGEDIDPYRLRQHLIDDIGIKPASWTVQPTIERNFPGHISAHPEIRAADKIKRIRTRRHHHKAAAPA